MHFGGPSHSKAKKLFRARLVVAGGTVAVPRDGMGWDGEREDLEFQNYITLYIIFWLREVQQDD